MGEPTARVRPWSVAGVARICHFGDRILNRYLNFASECHRVRNSLNHPHVLQPLREAGLSEVASAGVSASSDGKEIFHTSVGMSGIGIAKLIKEDPGNIQRELKRLEKVGFLSSEKQGNTKIYSTNKQFAIFKELQSIVIKSQQQSARPKRSAADL